MPTLARSLDRQRRRQGVAFAIHFVNCDLADTKHNQVGVDAVAGKVRYLGSFEPQLHPADRSTLCFSGCNDGDPGLGVTAARCWCAHINSRVVGWGARLVVAALHVNREVRLYLCASCVTFDDGKLMRSGVETYRLVERCSIRLGYFLSVGPSF